MNTNQPPYTISRNPVGCYDRTLAEGDRIPSDGVAPVRGTPPYSLDQTEATCQWYDEINDDRWEQFDTTQAYRHWKATGGTLVKIEPNHNKPIPPFETQPLEPPF